MLKFALIVLATACCYGQATFKNAELRTEWDGIKEGSQGSITTSREAISFVSKSGEIRIKPQDVTELFYSRVSGRRIKTAVVIAPWIAFTKGRKHYLTVSFNGEQAGALEFQLDKDNYRGAIRALEEITGKVSKYDEEGNPGQGMAVRGPDPATVQAQGVLLISSDPAGAEVYINGDFNGMTPRRKAVAPGEYEIRLEKRGLASRTQTVTVEAGATAEVTIALPAASLASPPRP